MQRLQGLYRVVAIFRAFCVETFVHLALLNRELLAPRRIEDLATTCSLRRAILALRLPVQINQNIPIKPQNGLKPAPVPMTLSRAPFIDSSFSDRLAKLFAEIGKLFRPIRYPEIRGIVRLEESKPTT